MKRDHVFNIAPTRERPRGRCIDSGRCSLVEVIIGILLLRVLY